MLRLIFSCFLSSAVLFTGCAQLSPYIQDFNVVSISQEKELSVNLAQTIAKEMTIVPNTAEARAVKDIGNRMVAALPRKDFDYEFFVVEDKTPNAFTIPGGKIYVHTGLLAMSTPAELAGVIGHEIGHAYERHPAKSLSRAYGMSFIAQLLLNKNAAAENKFKIIALQLAGSSILTKYGRDDERESDDISYYLLKKAGMPTEGLLSFLAKLKKLEGQTSQPPGFLRSHPPTAERIERLQALIQSNPPADLSRIKG